MSSEQQQQPAVEQISTPNAPAEDPSSDNWDVNKIQKTAEQEYEESSFALLSKEQFESMSPESIFEYFKHQKDISDKYLDPKNGEIVKAIKNAYYKAADENVISKFRDEEHLKSVLGIFEDMQKEASECLELAKKNKHADALNKQLDYKGTWLINGQGWVKSLSKESKAVENAYNSFEDRCKALNKAAGNSVKILKPQKNK